MAKQTKQAHAKALNDGTAPIQMGFFMPETDWRPPRVSDLPSWAGAKRIAIDAETRDPSIGNNLGSGPLCYGFNIHNMVLVRMCNQNVISFKRSDVNILGQFVRAYKRINYNMFSGNFNGECRMS